MSRVMNVENWLRSGKELTPTPEAPPETPTTPETPPAQPLEANEPILPEIPETPAEPLRQPEFAAPTPPAEPKEPNAPFKKIHRLEQSVRQLRQMVEQGRGNQPAPQQPVENQLPDLETNPVENIDMRLKRMEMALNQERQTNAALMQNMNTMAQENNFRANNPKYDPASRFLEQSEYLIWEKTGGLSALAAQMLDQNEEYFEREAALRGTAPEDLAIATAKQQITANGRAQLMEIARRTGRSMPEVLMDAASVRASELGKLAQETGFMEAAHAPAEAPQNAQARVQAAIERNRATSLSTMAPQSNSGPRTIGDRESLDSFLQTASPEERAKFIQDKDAEDAGWLEKMFQR